MRSFRSPGSNAPGADARARTAGGAAAWARGLLPAAVLTYALLGEPGAALTAAAAWALSRAAEAWPRGGARPNPGAAAPGAPTPEEAADPDRPLPRVSPFRPLPLAGIAGAVYLAVFLASDLLRGGLPGRSAFQDSVQSALACTVLLLPLGLPVAAVFLKGRTGREGFPRVEAFQFACCAGMSVAAAGSVLAGWLPPLSTGQLVWANAVGTALPSLALARLPGDAGPAAPSAGERPVRVVPDILISGLLLAVLLLAVYRLGLEYAGDAPRAADRARSLVFLALCLVQAGEPLAGLGTPPGAEHPRTRARELGTTPVDAFASLAPVAAAFLIPAARGLLGLTVPDPAAAFAAFAGSGIYLFLRFAVRKVLAAIPRNT